MKKILSLALTFLMLLSFTACSEKETKKSDKVDLRYYAELGQIPEIPYKLGADCDKVEKELEAEYEKYLSTDPENSADHDHDHYAEDLYFEVSEVDDYVYIDNGGKNYFYKKSEKKDGISYIVTFGDAFGFKMGDFIYDIQSALPNVEFIEEEITEGSLIFDKFLSSGTTLTAKFNDVTIMFVFMEGELYATAMYKTDSWK